MIYIVDAHNTRRGEYIGKPSPLGNPFNFNRWYDPSYTLDKYERWLRKQIKLNVPTVVNELERLYDIATRGDLFLGCHRFPKASHGEIIIKILNEKIEERKIMKDFNGNPIPTILQDKEYEWIMLNSKKSSRVLTKYEERRYAELLNNDAFQKHLRERVR